MSDRDAINRAVRLLIKREFQCYDAVADAINDVLGKNLNKGTISKRQEKKDENWDKDKPRQLVWPLEDLMVLQEIADYYPVLEMLKRNKQRNTEGQPTNINSCILTNMGNAAVEGGQAMEAAAKAAKSLNLHHYKSAAIEAREAAVEYFALADSLDAKVAEMNAPTLIPLKGQCS